MKVNKLSSLFFGILLVSASLSGCSKFPSLIPQLENIEVVANELKTFVKDDKIEDCVDLEIYGVYSDKSTKALNKSDVELVYINKKTGIGYSIEKEIPAAGEYYLRVTYGDVTVDDSYEFTAVQDHVYISSVSLEDCPTGELTLAVGRPQLITLNIEPEDTTERVYFNLINNNSVAITQIDKNIFEIEAEEECDIKLDIAALVSREQHLNNWFFDILCRNVYVCGMIPYGPKFMHVNETATFSLKVYPENYNVDVNALSIFGNIEISKQSAESYKVTALKSGTAFITFFAKKNFFEYIEVSYQFEIGDIYAQSISMREAEGSVGLNCEKTIILDVYPSNFTVDTEFFVLGAGIVSCEKIDNITYKIKGLHIGKAYILFTAASSKTSIAGFVYTISVEHVCVKKITANYPKTIETGEEAKITLDVEPSNFTVSIYVTEEDNKILSIEKITNTEYVVTGLSNGSSYITFIAPRNDIYDVEERIEITVVRHKERFNTKMYGIMPPDGLRKNKIVKTLVIPLWFKDSHKYIGDGDANSNVTKSMRNTIRTDIKEAFFGDARADGWNSVKSFYETESRGDWSTIGVLSSWYMAKKSASYYEDADVGSKDLGLYYLGLLLRNTVNQFFKDYPSENRKDYDSDGDGYLDSVVFVYAIPTKGRTTSNFWNMVINAFYFSSQKDVNKPGIRSCVWASYDSLYDAATALTKTGHTYARGRFYATPDARVFTHEMGHMFGLDDLYNNHNAVPAGGNNMQEFDFCGHDPFSCMQLHWIKSAYVPTESCTITIDDFQSSGDLIILSPDWDDLKQTPFGEYLLLELYTPTGLNRIDANHRSLTDAGIRLWHINGILSGNSYKYSNPNAKGPALFYDPNYGSQMEVIYPDIFTVHNIRKDNEKDFLKKIDYRNNRSINNENLFKKGDAFDPFDYRYQIYSYYKDAFFVRLIASTDLGVSDLTFDNGKKLDWSFTVDRLNYYEYSETARATITITRQPSSTDHYSH